MKAAVSQSVVVERREYDISFSVRPTDYALCDCAKTGRPSPAISCTFVSKPTNAQLDVIRTIETDGRAEVALQEEVANASSIRIYCAYSGRHVATLAEELHHLFARPRHTRPLRSMARELVRPTSGLLIAEPRRIRRWCTAVLGGIIALVLPLSGLPRLATPC